MSKWKSMIMIIAALITVVAALGTGARQTMAAGPLALFTPYTNISVTPGESIQYSVEVINNSSEIQNFSFRVSGLPEGWKYELTSGGWSIEEIAVLPDNKENVSLQVDVPLNIEKGSYSFQLVAPGKAVLPLTVNVTEHGTFKTELTTDQPNMEGHADSTFHFTAKLRNRTAEKQLYSLTAEVPQGWDIQFKVDGKSVTSVNVEANASKDIDVEIDPADQVKAGTYTIPVKASTTATSAQTELEVVITGSYDLELSTPSGLLSTEVTAGDEKKLELVVTNTGSAALRDIKLDAAAPLNWEVTFEPKEINKLEAGQTEKVIATIKADKKAISGDYVTSISARAPEASSEATIRVSVKTSVLWGWVGVLIIAAVLGGMYYIFRTYGRR